MPSNGTSACVTCRIARKGGSGVCERCGGKTIGMGKHWRAPKRTDKKAWARVAAGEYLTERSRTDYHEDEQKDGPNGRWRYLWNSEKGIHEYTWVPAAVKNRKRRRIKWHISKPWWYRRV